MSVDSLLASLGFIYGLWERQGLEVTHLTIEYVGGEVLLLSEREIGDCVQAARKFFAERHIVVIDGVQSNLIGTESRLKNLNSLFGGRVGTSVDSFSDKRKFKGSAKKYRTFFMEGERRMPSKSPTPAVFTVDNDTILSALDEVDLAMSIGRELMVRPVFAGGMAVEMPSPHALGVLYEKIIGRWWLKGSTRIEPFFSLLKKRLHHQYSAYPLENFDYCSFQSNCTSKSLSLEPNGDLFLCQDMADASQGILGNALSGSFNDALWEAMSMRPYLLSTDCYSCDYFKECQGGCMLKSIESEAGIHGKSAHCEAWKMLFAKLYDCLSLTDSSEVLSWIESMEKLP